MIQKWENNDGAWSWALLPNCVQVQQQNALSEWETLASTTVAREADVSLSFTPSYASMLKLIIKGHDLDAAVGSVRYKRVDIFNASVVSQICNNDAFDDDYRFGFNGQMKDNEIKGVGNSLDFGARIFDSRLGVWLSNDPLKHKYPSVSPYSFGLESPIQFKDEGGRFITDKNGTPIYRNMGTFPQTMKDYPHYKIMFEGRIYFTNDGQEVKALKYTSVIDVRTGKEISDDEMKSFATDCHGTTLLNGDVYIPGEVNGKDNIDKIVFNNITEFTPILEGDLKRGDITTLSIGGLLNHSMKLEDPINGIYATKNDRDPLKVDAKSDDPSVKQYGKVSGHYRHIGNFNSGIESENGQVSENTATEVVQKAKTFQNVREKFKNIKLKI